MRPWLVFVVRGVGCILGGWGIASLAWACATDPSADDPGDDSSADPVMDPDSSWDPGFGVDVSPGPTMPPPAPPPLPPASRPSATDPPDAIAPDPDGGGDDGSPWDATDEDLAEAAAGPPFDAGEGGICSAPISPGDLVIDELMIASVAGTGDHGEWFEISSTLDCAVNLRGLRGDVPSGSNVRTFAVGDDLWIPARGTLVVADSTNGTLNHALPGPIVAWSGQPGDVLRNKGDTLTLRMNGAVIDTLTYPALTIIAGTSIAFPSDCPESRRTDWTAWQPSNASWLSGFYGTPNAANDDVQCP